MVASSRSTAPRPSCRSDVGSGRGAVEFGLDRRPQRRHRRAQLVGDVRRERPLARAAAASTRPARSTSASRSSSSSVDPRGAGGGRRRRSAWVAHFVRRSTGRASRRASSTPIIAAVPTIAAPLRASSASERSMRIRLTDAGSSIRTTLGGPAVCAAPAPRRRGCRPTIPRRTGRRAPRRDERVRCRADRHRRRVRRRCRTPRVGDRYRRDAGTGRHRPDRRPESGWPRWRRRAASSRLSPRSCAAPDRQRRRDEERTDGGQRDRDDRDEDPPTHDVTRPLPRGQSTSRAGSRHRGSCVIRLGRPGCSPSLRRIELMWTSSVFVEPHQFSSQTSSISCSRVTTMPASTASRWIRSNSFGRSAISSVPT